jgi:hypothetical protein
MTAFPAVVGNNYTLALTFRADTHKITSNLAGIIEDAGSSEKDSGVRAMVKVGLLLRNFTADVFRDTGNRARVSLEKFNSLAGI